VFTSSLLINGRLALAPLLRLSGVMSQHASCAMALQVSADSIFSSIYLLIYGLLSDAVSNTERQDENNELLLGMNMEGTDLVIWGQNPGTCLEGMREPTNTFNQDNQSPDRDSNPRPPELEAEC
jgi:hypothetical protein